MIGLVCFKWWYQKFIDLIFCILLMIIVYLATWVSGKLWIVCYSIFSGVRSDVAQYCRSCHVCQIIGKPNQSIPVAPLHPIPAIAEPFEQVLIDCVGPLLRTKSGNQYILTIICAATRLPEVVQSLRKVTAPAISRALVKFFSVWVSKSCTVGSRV